MIEAYLKAARGDKVGLDFGGGNGLAASLLRDRGWNYDSFDPFGDDHRKAGSRYDFCSAFEVFEHVPDPMRSLKEILDHCSNEKLFIVIGTNVSDGIVTPDTGLEWWYAAPRNGHISLYTHKSLSYLAQTEGLSYLSLGKNLHFLSRGYSRMEIFRIALEGKGRRIINKKALSSFLRAAESAN